LNNNLPQAFVKNEGLGHRCIQFISKIQFDNLEHPLDIGGKVSESIGKKKGGRKSCPDPH